MLVSSEDGDEALDRPLAGERDLCQVDDRNATAKPKRSGLARCRHAEANVLDEPREPVAPLLDSRVNATVTRFHSPKWALCDVKREVAVVQLRHLVAEPHAPAPHEDDCSGADPQELGNNLGRWDLFELEHLLVH